MILTLTEVAHLHHSIQNSLCPAKFSKSITLSSGFMSLAWLTKHYEKIYENKGYLSPSRPFLEFQTFLENNAGITTIDKQDTITRKNWNIKGWLWPILCNTFTIHLSNKTLTLDLFILLCIALILHYISKSLRSKDMSMSVPWECNNDAWGPEVIQCSGNQHTWRDFPTCVLFSSKWICVFSNLCVVLQQVNLVCFVPVPDV